MRPSGRNGCLTLAGSCLPSRLSSRGSRSMKQPDRSADRRGRNGSAFGSSARHTCPSDLRSVKEHVEAASSSISRSRTAPTCSYGSVLLCPRTWLTDLSQEMGDRRPRRPTPLRQRAARSSAGAPRPALLPRGTSGLGPLVLGQPSAPGVRTRIGRHSLVRSHCRPAQMRRLVRGRFLAC